MLRTLQNILLNFGEKVGSEFDPLAIDVAVLIAMVSTEESAQFMSTHIGTIDGQDDFVRVDRKQLQNRKSPATIEANMVQTKNRDAVKYSGRWFLFKGSKCAKGPALCVKHKPSSTILLSTTFCNQCSSTSIYNSSNTLSASTRRLLAGKNASSHGIVDTSSSNAISGYEDEYDWADLETDLYHWTNTLQLLSSSLQAVAAAVLCQSAVLCQAVAAAVELGCLDMLFTGCVFYS
ncbi:GTP-binding family protein [Artemisia annua]|uniref:GTP-binding family protein n=1 Tax=Artemisia annua TaxID=35608 RepID=A0A2U1LA56_ARTAN|nr:GTP-binding family protein [Artemisia annua]